MKPKRNTRRSLISNAGALPPYAKLTRCPQPARIDTYYNIAVPDDRGGTRMVKMSPKGGPYKPKRKSARSKRVKS